MVIMDDTTVTFQDKFWYRCKFTVLWDIYSAAKLLDYIITISNIFEELGEGGGFGWGGVVDGEKWHITVIE